MISIIVPAFNAAETLPACLTALLRQTLYPDEIIVVDDGSEDQTTQVAREYRAHVLEQSHQGPAAARNLGISQAQGDIILFTDADCEPEPNWVAEMLLPFNDPRVMGVKGSYGTHQPEPVARLVQCEFEERYDRLEKLDTIDFIDTYAAAFRLSSVQQVGGFNTAFPRADNEDVELSYRLALKGCRFIFNRRAIVIHRHPNTWRAYLSRKIRRGYWRMMVYRLHPGKAMRDSYTPQILKVQIILMYLALALVGIASFFPPMVWGEVVIIILLCISAIPFIHRVIKQNSELAPAALMFIFVRAFAFAIGVGGGILGMFFFRPEQTGTK